jgi:hypothetical protein
LRNLPSNAFSDPHFGGGTMIAFVFQSAGEDRISHFAAGPTKRIESPISPNGLAGGTNSFLEFGAQLAETIMFGPDSANSLRDPHESDFVDLLTVDTGAVGTGVIGLLLCVCIYALAFLCGYLLV